MVKINVEKLVLERANQGLSIIELSKKSGVHRQTISRIEKGILTPRLDTVGKLAKALEKPVEDFLEK